MLDFNHLSANSFFKMNKSERIFGSDLSKNQKISELIKNLAIFNINPKYFKLIKKLIILL
tara:strand:+ start:272 stop:451 length:180 start_codon:yes stop_codon:yes gene_type:complete